MTMTMTMRSTDPSILEINRTLAFALYMDGKFNITLEEFEQFLKKKGFTNEITRTEMITCCGKKITLNELNKKINRNFLINEQGIISFVKACRMEGFLHAKRVDGEGYFAIKKEEQIAEKLLKQEQEEKEEQEHRMNIEEINAKILEDLNKMSKCMIKPIPIKPVPIKPTSIWSRSIESIKSIKSTTKPIHKTSPQKLNRFGEPIRTIEVEPKSTHCSNSYGNNSFGNNSFGNNSYKPRQIGRSDTGRWR